MMGSKVPYPAVVPPSMKPAASASLHSTKIDGPDLPLEYRHLSLFPVLAKVARGPSRFHPNDRITQFLKENLAPASYIADYLTVRDRLAFLQTHKVGLPPKLLRPLLFNGPSRELDYLYCPVSVTYNKNDTKSTYLNHYLQLEVRYRGSFLSRAVPLRLVAHALHRVIRGWLNNRLRKRGFATIMAMVNKLLAVFRPTEEVWHAVVNYCAEDGTTLLTYAIAADLPLPVIQKLIEIPCFDLGLPDARFQLTPFQLAQRVGRDDLVSYFKSITNYYF